MAKIGDFIKNPIKTFANSKPVKRICKNYRENNSKFITGFSVASIVAKDGYGCYIYVKQNQNNKSIPEEKRKFLSGLDLATGTLMIAAQLLAYATVSKKAVQKKIFEKALGKYFNKDFQKLLSQKTNLEDNPERFQKEFEKYKENIFVAFTHLFTLVLTTILAKRVLVPFIATPMADKLQKHFDKKA